MYLEISVEMPDKFGTYPPFLPLYSSRVRFDADGEDCGPFVEVLVVGDVEVGLAKQAGCEAYAEDAVDPKCGKALRSGGIQRSCWVAGGDRTLRLPQIPA
jgi:hypothetical protein